MGYVHFKALQNQNLLKIDVKDKWFNNLFLVDEKCCKYHKIIPHDGYSTSSTINGLVSFLKGFP